MRGKVISIGQLRSQIGAYEKFRFVADSPLTPVSITATFDHAAVCIGASPYIALRNKETSMLISGIKCIGRENTTNGTVFYLCCLDHLTEAPVEVTYKIECK